jgi:hypothetical protein
VFWKSIKRLWSSAPLVEVVAVAVVAAVVAVVGAVVVVEVSIEADNQVVVRVDVAVVGNNSDAALEAEATAEAILLEAAATVLVVALDEAGVLDAEENAHKKKKRGIQ